MLNLNLLQNGVSSFPNMKFLQIIYISKEFYIKGNKF